MNIRILAIGSNLPKWVNEGCQVYEKYLRSFPQLKCIVQPVRSPKKATMSQQGEMLLKHIQKTDYVIALDRLGKSCTTIFLSEYLESAMLEGRHLVFLIGGSEGLSQSCLERAQANWSLSDLTLSHAFARLILLEQIYRAFTILTNHPYHR